MAKTKQIFSEHVKFVRMTLRLSQSELAKAIGVSYATIGRWERENREPQMKTLGLLYKYCECIGIDLKQGSESEDKS